MEKSINEKLQKLYELSCNLAYVDHCKVVDTDKLYGKAISDIIWSIVDGLYSQWVCNMIEGRCSLQAMIEFDLSTVEKQIDDRIEKLQNINHY